MIWFKFGGKRRWGGNHAWKDCWGLVEDKPGPPCVWPGWSGTNSPVRQKAVYCGCSSNRCSGPEAKRRTVTEEVEGRSRDAPWCALHSVLGDEPSIFPDVIWRRNQLRWVQVDKRRQDGRQSLQQRRGLGSSCSCRRRWAGDGCLDPVEQCYLEPI